MAEFNKIVRANDLNILIACEESGTELKIWRDAGFNAFACDVQKPSHNDFAHFYFGYVQKLAIYDLAKGVDFRTLDGCLHHVDHWDLVIGHPPCTYLSRAGAWAHKDYFGEPLSQCYEARKFFDFLLYFPGASFTLIENPTPWSRVLDIPCDFSLQPYWFGDKLSKRTCYWTSGLPPFPAKSYKIAKPTGLTTVEKLHGSVARSKTPLNMARALFDYYSEFLINYYGKF